jgi:hypothetical protein
MSGRQRWRDPSLPARTGGGYRFPDVADRIEASRARRDGHRDTSTSSASTPVPQHALDDVLPAERVAIDLETTSTQRYLRFDEPATAWPRRSNRSAQPGERYRRAPAQPTLAVAALATAALMSASELRTVVRLALPMLVVVYNDAAWAEVTHFGPGTTSARSWPGHRPGGDGAVSFPSRR